MNTNLSSYSAARKIQGAWKRSKARKSLAVAKARSSKELLTMPLTHTVYLKSKCTMKPIILDAAFGAQGFQSLVFSRFDYSGFI